MIQQIVNKAPMSTMVLFTIVLGNGLGQFICGLSYVTRDFYKFIQPPQSGVPKNAKHFLEKKF